MEVAVDHDQLAGVPAHKGKDEEGKDPVHHPLGIVVEDNQAEGQVDGEGQGCGDGVNVMAVNPDSSLMILPYFTADKEISQ
jgi:hypothetical protein